MSKELLKKVAVRVRVIAPNGSDRSCGSGVITTNKAGKYLVITAEHCIGGKSNNRLQDVSMKNILVEYKENNEDDFNLISVTDIIYQDREHDIAILEVDKVSELNEYILHCKFSTLAARDLLFFRGYPKWLNESNSAMPYEATLKDPDKSQFIIKCDEIKDITVTRMIDETSNGISGSGVFIIRNSRLFLLGIITDLRDEHGTFGHIICKRLDKIIEDFNLDYQYLKDGAKSLYNWNIKLDEKYIKDKIMKLRQDNDEDFNRLYRKCTMLYEQEDVDLMVEELLKDYYTAEVHLDEIGKINPLMKDYYETAALTLAKRVKRFFNKKQISDKDKAQGIYAEVTELFEELLQKIINANEKENNEKDGIGNSMIMNSSDKAVTDLLLNCDLDFKKI